MRWKAVFLPVNEFLALKAEAEAPGSGLAPLLVWAAFSRRA